MNEKNNEVDVTEIYEALCLFLNEYYKNNPHREFKKLPTLQEIQVWYDILKNKS